MSNKNEVKLENQLEQLALQDDSKYLEELLDDALVTAMKGDQKVFCLKIETYLTEFMKSQKSTEKILSLDKFQRKMVHKICDIYSIKRDYVDVKSDDTGDITITKTETSKIPEKSLEASYKKYLDSKTKSTQKPQSTFVSTNPGKILIKKKSDPNPQGNQIASNSLIVRKKNPNDPNAIDDKTEEELKEDIEIEKKRRSMRQRKTGYLKMKTNNLQILRKQDKNLKRRKLAQMQTGTTQLLIE